MEIKRFGNIEGKTMMLLHGNLMCWQQFEDLIPLLERKFCVYAVSFDGFDGTGETTYTTARDQADKLAAYIEKELDGQLDLLFAESLGCGPAVFLKASPNIQFGRMILSGPEYLDFGVLNRLILKVMPQKQYRTAHEKYMPAWALRFMGQTEQGMQTMLRRIPDHISLESVRATWEAGLYLYRTDFLVQPDAKVACWYGEKEGHMKKAIQRLRTAYPNLIVRCFPGFGHGDIINHPALLASELERFLADGETLLAIKHRAVDKLRFLGKLIDGNKRQWPYKLFERTYRNFIRTQTEALGGDCCDYWYVGDKSPALEAYRDLERI